MLTHHGPCQHFLQSACRKHSTTSTTSQLDDGQSSGLEAMWSITALPKAFLLAQAFEVLSTVEVHTPGSTSAIVHAAEGLFYGSITSPELIPTKSPMHDCPSVL